MDFTPAKPEILTLAFGLSWIETASLDDVQKRDLASAVVTASRWFGRSPEQVPLDPPALRRCFKSVSPGTTGVTKKRIANVKCSLRFLQELMGIGSRGVADQPLSPAWTQKISAVGNKYARDTLVRLGRYCAGRGIEPEGVCDQVADDFRQHLEMRFRVTNPRHTHRETVRLWCRFVDQTGLQPLTIPSYSRTYLPPWSAFHPDLVKDIERYLSRHAVVDPFDLSAPVRALKPSTIATYRDRLHRFAGCLILTGKEPAELRSLVDLVQLEAVERGLRYLIDIRDAKPLAAVIANLLADVAADLGQPEPTVDAISEIASRLRADRKGLSPKVRERLRPLKHEANLARLFLLPTALTRALLRKPTTTVADARLFQIGLALALLTVCPLRIGALCSIRLDRHLNWSAGNMKGDLTIEFDPGELKNDEPGSFPIPPDVAALVRVFCERFRPLLKPGGSPFLFSGAKPDAPKDKGGLSGQIKRLIFDRLGFTVNPHLYRHIVHLVVLRRFPGAYGMIARVLTHRSISTTIQNYAYLDGEIAMRAYQGLVGDVIAGRPGNATDLATVASSFDREGPKHDRR